MTEPTDNRSAAPVWARDEAFPAAPGGYGWTDAKGNRRPCGSFEELARQIREGPCGTVFLVWTPSHPRMRLPEEIEGLAEPLETARQRYTDEDFVAASHRLRVLGGVLSALAVWKFLAGFIEAGRFGARGFIRLIQAGLHEVLASPALGLVLLGFVIFAFIPWYQARKRRAERHRRTTAETHALVPVLRFESWLELQAAPVTRIVLGLLTAVWLAQWWHDGSLFVAHESVKAAGLVKPAYLGGEWWRLLTAPMMHGGLVHFLMNGAALLYLGKRMEVLARWPHLPLVFLFAACVGGEASVRFVAAPSVGASGGLMGWLGFLIVFETLHGRLVPRSARRRLVAGVLLTGLIGVLGYRFIDNAAHLGGLLAGFAYAFIVFPKSTSANRPGTTLTDRVAGTLALAVMTATAVAAVLKIVAF